MHKPLEPLMREFFQRFLFEPDLSRAIGVEREFFLMGPIWDCPVPASRNFLDKIQDAAWTYELSACQVEHRTRPHLDKNQLLSNLRYGTLQGKRVAKLIGCRLVSREVGPEDMTLQVHPNDRYKKIASKLSAQKISAACRVTGTHLHVGAGSIEEALEFYNQLVRSLSMLTRLGDSSNGERMRLYKAMASDSSPPLYNSPRHFFEQMLLSGYADNPRNCWHVIRISPHGTVEIRVFGSTADEDEIMHWQDLVLGLIS